MKGILRICCCFIVLFTAPLLQAQVFGGASGNPSQNRSPDEIPRLIYYDAVSLPSTDSAKSRLDVTFRAPYSFFIFVRNEKFTSLTDTSGYDYRWPFVANADISMELLDQNGVSVARELARKTIGAVDPEPKKHRDDFVEGILSFAVPPGDYTIAFQINDLESNRQFLETSEKVTARDFARDSLGLSDVLFVEPSEHSANSAFTPVNLGGDAFFGHNFDAYLEFVYRGSHDSDLRLSYSLYKLEDRSNDTTFFARDSVHAGAVRSTKAFSIEQNETGYGYRDTAVTSSRVLSALLPVDGNQLPRGSYELRVTVSDDKITRSTLHPFEVRWVDMPRSLWDLEFAIETLQYIATKDELSDLRAMFAKDRKGLFEDFWKKRDPTPRTAFNEAKAEYYRRVDYAIDNFGTVTIPNGFKTDRGKVYILYGDPTHTQRTFSPTNPPRETWEYQNLKKRFVFVDESLNGNYKLVATEAM